MPRNTERLCRTIFFIHFYKGDILMYIKYFKIKFQYHITSLLQNNIIQELS